MSAETKWVVQKCFCKFVEHPIAAHTTHSGGRCRNIALNRWEMMRNSYRGAER